jgi:hypothetical protein
MKMKPHFRAAIAEMDEDLAKLDADAARLRAARDTLDDLYSGEVLAAPEAKKKVVRPARGDARPTSPAAAPLDSTRNRLISVALKLPEPLTAPALANAGAVQSGNAAYYLNSWLKLGYLADAGWGKFNRTEKFPKS